MDNRNTLQRGYDEMKDQVSTRKDAISESTKYSSQKDDTGEKIADAIVRPKEDVKEQTWSESAKNLGISAYNTVSDTVNKAYESLTGSGGSSSERK
ncbi:hypothetical protein C9374_013418 [Naegleria lovaniensis]|uniref:Uncharacterized protein n=1 Tax=Naegleria lovaniensis TaxID=51637 RepID=A0AA88KAN1_NAELO|nr:uncharacterized protein C9374_013830 [Naegleria lovaniensis]XP_044553827.1 uncharacterized protein C9374_013418 [Naegleria lovaniensis]KAG2370826.1 hypothetical protein C9374_013830 [Naegleria lovaniensis]KAG2391933.1 hypothetical protein C9374_013418 [Naegleria lovaniensis]